MDNRAFTVAVALSLLVFVAARFELVPLEGAVALLLEAFATVGAGVVLGLMAFGFFGRRTGIAVGVLAMLALAPLTFGNLRGYVVLLSSLNAYGVSATVCVLLSLCSRERFDFDLIGQRVTSFQQEATCRPGGEDDALPTLSPEVTR